MAPACGCSAVPEMTSPIASRSLLRRWREAVCCDDKGVPSFDRIRYHRHDGSVFLYAFDLIEL
jgi:hypothetical protein